MDGWWCFNESVLCPLCRLKCPSRGCESTMRIINVALWRHHQLFLLHLLDSAIKTINIAFPELSHTQQLLTDGERLCSGSMLSKLHQCGSSQFHTCILYLIVIIYTFCLFYWGSLVFSTELHCCSSEPVHPKQRMNFVWYCVRY